jgi:acyl-CoA synthetase (AMP-forming)/AMP-acid ligase II
MSAEVMSTKVYRTELTPLSFLRRSAYLFPEKTAVIYGDRRYTYKEFEERVDRLASRLREADLLRLRHRGSGEGRGRRDVRRAARRGDDG